MDDKSKDHRELLRAALNDRAVQSAAAAIKKDGKASTLAQTIELARALSEACGAKDLARGLRAELIGYAEAAIEIPPERKALGFASPFPVRALDLGLLDPEEIFLANREKFSQVTLTIGQPIDELVTALAQIRQGGVLALRVPASEVTGESANTDDDAEVFIYILPREIQKIVDAARARALEAITRRIAEAALNEALPT
jgi:hypothetical protein